MRLALILSPDICLLSYYVWTLSEGQKCVSESSLIILYLLKYEISICT